MACIDSCRYCGGAKRCAAFSCDECNGTNTRNSIRKRTTNLAVGLYAAALEELRVRAAVRRFAHEYRHESNAARRIMPCR